MYVYCSFDTLGFVFFLFPDLYGINFVHIGRLTGHTFVEIL